MTPRGWLVLGACLLAAPAAGCHSFMDLDVTYQECVDVPGNRYVEQFSGETLQSLRERCWRVDNPGNAPSGIEQKVFVDDTDLVMRVEDGGSSADLDEWTQNDQAPLVYRRVEGDFLVVVRAEAATKAKADHCLPPGNAAGLALRVSDQPEAWATWTVEPYLWTNGTQKADCLEDADETNNPTATVRLRSSNPSQWVETEYEDVGLDGEADIVICRVDDRVYYQYGKATADPTKNLWLPAGSGVSHTVGTGAIDLGLTVHGRRTSVTPPATPPETDFAAAGHFNWVVFDHGTYGDGCSGVLDLLTLPEDE